MSTRINYAEVSPEALNAVYGLQGYVNKSSIEPGLRDLVLQRASQINGCAFCLDMHAHEARNHGESQQRLDLLSVWRDVPFYTDRERAALSWTESVTLLADTHVPDDVYDEAREHFSDRELVDLTMVVATINVWNRLSVSFRREPPKR